MPTILDFLTLRPHQARVENLSQLTEGRTRKLEKARDLSLSQGRIESYATPAINTMMQCKIRAAKTKQTSPRLSF
jgi:hypothetical protein